MLPEPTFYTRAFWYGGAEGQLKIAYCDGCDVFFHPPGPVCRQCRGRDVSFRPVSGRATVEAFTVNHQAWRPDLAVPYVIASVRLPEPGAVRLVTSLVGCDPESVAIGMAVKVCFEAVEDIFLPMFTPYPAAPSSPR